MSIISIFLIDDHKIFLQSFHTYILTQPLFQWVGSNEGDDEVFDTVLKINPDVILLDYHLRKMSGIQILKHLRTKGFTKKIIFLSMNRDIELRKEAMDAGSNGFVTKDVDGTILLNSIINLFYGNIDYLEIPKRLEKMENNIFGFTPQEIVIAKMICKGQSSEDVAMKLFISIHTVHTHRRKILEKTKSENFIQVCQKINASLS
jgi:two-component system secretion response regulator SsrB